MIRFLDKHTRIPVPSIRFFDFTSNNPLGQRYCIQPRLPGANAMLAYPKLNIQQKVSFASEYGKALAGMQAKTYSCAGILDPKGTRGDFEQVPMHQFDVPPRDFHGRFGDFSDCPGPPAVPQTTLDFLLSMFKRQRTFDLKHNRIYLNPWEELTKVAHAMNDIGLFDDNKYYVTHMDLEPRNLLVHVKDDGTATLGGILDWDSGVFAPRWMGCKPPSWLRDWQYDDDEDELKANKTPVDPGMQEVKYKFEEAIGQDWLRYAYTPEYRIARNVCLLALRGTNDSDAYRLVDSTIEEWEKLHPFPDVTDEVEDEMEVGEESSSDEDSDPSPSQGPDVEPSSIL
ncbi:uncharacterized protein BDZ99DRAFT_465534 [Mytilinidion resinicola]|uniref:Aminoglycoside phosphotransferase domain-containing protein n=1 Tax=Mytilinidion resinicola TaxID=574789 RepID=A0A6A6YFS3_9PEZI|nr:uncharacterized protein BDZ99DRAFT_465534 [Mytilinidion resinicola]KAF2806737.1 hypothetical protein BDZ99DRAFT_465534 [Mytilinidion resinicola]